MMISVREAASFLKMDVQTVRLLLQSGQVAWGQAIKPGNSNHYTYLIYPKKFAELTGYKLNGGVDNG